MSAILTPVALAFDVAAALVEWALNLVVSIPALAIKAFNHRDTVLFDTGLCGS